MKSPQSSGNGGGAVAGVAANPGLPVVRRINKCELSVQEREKERVRIRNMDAEERGNLFWHLIAEFNQAGVALDRVYMRNAIYRFQCVIDEHPAAVQLTTTEMKDWLALASAALMDTKATNVPSHCDHLVRFWHAYCQRH